MKDLKMTELSQRDKMLQRVINLRSRAEDDAASENEMNTALTKAAKLMDSYNIEEAELALAENEGRIVLEVINKVADTSAFKGKQKHKILLALVAISKFTETQVIYSAYSGQINFTGHRPDVELANYVTALVRNALDMEYATYRKNNVAVGYGAKAAFQTAMARRISSRLMQIAEDREMERDTAKEEAEEKLQIDDANTSSSMALIICEIADQKEKEVSAAYKAAYPRARTTTMSYSNGSRNKSAHSAGTSAGNKVSFNRAIA